MARVTLLTDFGAADGYVAAMKGAIATVAPSVIIDDAAHDVLAGDVRTAAWALAGYWRIYPAGTVHVAVIDPGVGGSRRALALEADGRFLVGPDNGVFTRVLQQVASVRMVSIEATAFMRDVISSTFHGRDIFGPAAAYLATGTPLDALGPEAAEPYLLPLPQPRRSVDAVHGEVVHVDRFGNLVTNIPLVWMTAGAVVRIGAHVLPLRRTYGDVESGAPVALTGSHGCVEISVRDDDARWVLGADVGVAVSLTGLTRGGPD
jgi:S-adenosyl-L-methionine hydrolase (adenosine-forming)